VASAGSIREELIPEGSPELAADGVDPELLALPAPARGRRVATLALMALAVVAALALLASTRRDIAYFFADSAPLELGEAVELDPADLQSNTFVTLEGTPMASGLVSYGRVLGSSSYQAFPLAGQRNVYVQVPVADDDAARTSPRREFSGRLVSFGEAGGRFGTVRRFLENKMGMPVSSGSYLLLADEPPSSYLSGLALAALASLAILVNLLLFVRLFRAIHVTRDAKV
tara:strand:+ start:84 stop:770 length:687 start_codon:yes stop_codon:yes gene_type:complete